ncbi:hypothetical protein KDL01_16515 [Actinospica durhamensis]|uniref:Uncharacterized protein n=1 Tax=Actinospica durhamensis TaxID=1508375 RepID=A0A941EPS2_9ACTN|nr:hypothetical protein [Actinospica durhamensis]MBR7834878.1 hypothetical protein [Actinospica durhamensis]
MTGIGSTATGNTDSTASTDSLLVWLRVRREADWRHAPVLRRDPGVRDGFRAWCEGPVRGRDPVRAERLLAAYAVARADAERRAPLDFALLAGWQREILGGGAVPRGRRLCEGRV